MFNDFWSKERFFSVNKSAYKIFGSSLNKTSLDRLIKIISLTFSDIYEQSLRSSFKFPRLFVSLSESSACNWPLSLNKLFRNRRQSVLLSMKAKSVPHRNVKCLLSNYQVASTFFCQNSVKLLIGGYGNYRKLFWVNWKTWNVCLRFIGSLWITFLDWQFLLTLSLLIESVEKPRKKLSAFQSELRMKIV